VPRKIEKESNEALHERHTDQDRREAVLHNRDKTKKMRDNIKLLEKEELVEKSKRGQYMWTLRGRRALNAIITDEKKEALSQGLPWPPSPTYYRDMRRLNKNED
jgi:hypothetical protein